MPPSAAKYDAIVIGAGHNGLVCAFYLARAGKKVLVLEGRNVIGGAAFTEEFHPGFRNSLAAYTVSLLSPQVIQEMELEQRGLRIVLRKASNFLPTADGRYLMLGRGAAADCAEIAKFSRRDAEAYPRFGAMLDSIVAPLRALVGATPPDPKGGVVDFLAALRLAAQMNALSAEAQRDLLTFFTRSAGEILDDWFESDPIKAVLGFDSVVGNFASPYTPGSGYVLLHHVFGEVNGVKGAWGHAIGGMGAITHAMAEACCALDVAIETGAPVAAIATEGGAATGVVLKNGSSISADLVVSSVHPTILFERLLPPDALDPAFLQRMRRWKSGSATFRMNVALSAPPSFTASPGHGDHLTAGIIMAPSLRYMERAFDEARMFGWSRAPIVEMLVPSTLDSSLAPPGQHVASLFCQHFSFDLPGGLTWDKVKEDIADLILETVDGYAPGFSASVIARRLLSPLDLERELGLIRGDIFHGALTLDQLFSARPMLGHGDYRAPVAGLYLCGSGAHPGGGVTGLPGRNAAREILRDLRFGGPHRRRFRA
jgi:phytoene dehydrogenase-like protein